MTQAAADNLQAEKKQKPAFNFLWVLYVLGGLIALGVIAFAVFRPVTVLPRITLGPGYSLTDQDGNRLTNEDVRGQIVLYNIMHTDCEPPCSEMSAIMQETQARLGEVQTGGIPVKFVSISINPDHDTPEVLREYAARHEANSDQWSFVTGPKDRLKWIIGGGFGTYFDQKEDGRIVFDPSFVLIDGGGILRAEYSTAVPNVDILLRDIQLLADEAQNSEGAARYAYEAAHLFLCYPRG